MFSKLVYLIPAFLSVVTGTLLPRSADAPTSVAPILDFDYSAWIWTGETGAHLGVRPFRKKISYSPMQYPVCATILISSGDIYSININGVEIGAGVGWKNPAVYTVALNPEGDNVFAIAVNIGQAPSLIATIVVDYKDGTSQTIVTDSTWKTLQAPPPSGWTNPSLDDSTWNNAVPVMPGTRTPWGQPFVLPPALNMTGVPWIKTNETGDAPRGDRPFRKTITSPYRKAAICGKIVLSVEDSYTLYFNGKNISSGNGPWRNMQAFSMSDLNSTMNVIAVHGTNLRANSRAYLAASMLIAYNDGSSEVYSTDESWKTLNALPPVGLEQPGADDSKWDDATVWGTDPDITVPSA
ncbi:lectin [Armillaria borealis]|uniref:Lectin n=1 Tax=Armillaria borealis TaxID=47425 RepID=A0AA39MJ13_9AGAR|nr:lectin [Armillaria borealis]